MSFNRDTGMYEGYIYLITNKINGKTYVGQTTKTIEKRWKQHLSHSKYDNYPLYYAMRKHGIDNFYIELLDIIEEQTFDDLIATLNDLEICYISIFDSLKNGYNATAGGENSSERWKVPIDVYDTDGNFLKSFDSSVEASKFYNVRESDISSISSGSNNRRQANNLVFRRKGEPFDKYQTRKAIEVKPIYQFNIKDGSLIKVHLTHDELKDVISIQSAIRNKYALWGFYWSYEKTICLDDMKKKNRIKVIQYDKSGDVINAFNSILEASFYLYGKKERGREQHAYYNGIRNAINGKDKSYCGFIWRKSTDKFDDFDVNIKPATIPVNKYTKDDIYLDTYSTVTNAVNSVGKNSTSAISRCCKGKLNSAYGYKWFYADDPNQPNKTKIMKKDVA